MKRFARVPLAAACLAAGGFVGMLLSDRIHGQAPPAAPPPAIPRELTSYRDIVKQVLPAVVSIEAKAAVRRPAEPARRTRPQLPPGVPEEFRRFFEGTDFNDDPRQPQSPYLGFGSGFVIDAGGVILTNAHVVAGAESVEVEFHDGRKLVSKDIRRDPKTDLAVVKVQTDKPLAALSFGDSDAMEVGDRVLAVGAPFGLTGSVTHGIISATRRRNLRLNQYEDFLQTDAAMNPGNSGGPLVNLAGQVIGINSAIKTRNGGSSGVGLAVSSNLAKDVSRQLLAGGVVRRGYLGVGIREVDPELAARLGVQPGTGVLVSKVYDNTPAAKAGLEAGDVITAVAGKPVTEAAALPRMIALLPLDKPTEFTYVRDGKPHAVQVVITEQPEEYGLERTPTQPVPRGGGSQGVEVAGVTVTDLTPEAAAQLGFPRDAHGALVTAVAQGTPAAETALARGMLITKVDRTPVSSAKDFQQAMAGASKEKGALLQVQRPNGETDFVVLKVQ